MKLAVRWKIADLHAISAARDRIYWQSVCAFSDMSLFVCIRRGIQPTKLQLHSSQSQKILKEGFLGAGVTHE